MNIKKLFVFTSIFFIVGILGGIYYLTQGNYVTVMVGKPTATPTVTATPSTLIPNLDNLEPIIVTPTSPAVISERSSDDEGSVFASTAFTGNRGYIYDYVNPDVYVPNSVKPGQKFYVRWTIYNTGTTDWTSNSRHNLGTLSPWDNSIWGGGRFPLQQTKGSYGVYWLRLTAPTKTGNYTFKVGLVQDGVQWFGAPSKGYTISVGDTRCDKTGNYCAQYISSVIDSSYTVGDKKTVSVTYKNVGKSTWEGNERIGVVMANPIYDAQYTGMYASYLANDEIIKPNETKTFTFTTDISTSITSATVRQIQFRMFTQKDTFAYGQGLFGDYSPEFTVTLNPKVGTTTVPTTIVATTSVPVTTQVPSITTTTSITPTPPTLSITTSCQDKKSIATITWPVSADFLAAPGQFSYVVDVSTTSGTAGFKTYRFFGKDNWTQNTSVFPENTLLTTSSFWYDYSLVPGATYYVRVAYLKYSQLYSNVASFVAKSCQ